MPLVDRTAVAPLLGRLRALYAEERRHPHPDVERLQAIERAALRLSAAARAADPLDHGQPGAADAARELASALGGVLVLAEEWEPLLDELRALVERVPWRAPRVEVAEEPWAGKRKGGG